MNDDDAEESGWGLRKVMRRGKMRGFRGWKYLYDFFGAGRGGTGETYGW